MQPAAGNHTCPHCQDFENIQRTVAEILAIVEEIQEDLKCLKENESHASDQESEDSMWQEDDFE